MNKIIACIKKLNSFESSLFVYSLSYSLLLTILPAVTVAVYSFQFLEFDPISLIEGLSHFLPETFITPFIEFLLTKNSTTFLLSLISITISLYLSSRCIYSFLLISISNEKVDYPLWSLRIYSIYEFVLIYFYVLAYLMINSLFDSFLITTILYFGASLFGFYTFYHLCTFKVREKTYGLIGACFSSIAIYLIGTLFFTIITTFTNYENVYGPLSSFMILLLVVFIISLVIYMGYIINNEYAHQKNDVYRNNTFFKICAKIEKKIKERIQYESRN